MDKQPFVDLLTSLKSKQEEKHPDLEPLATLKQLETETIDQVHSYIPSCYLDNLKRVREQQCKGQLELYRKIVILMCLLKNWNAIFSEQYPLSIRKQFERNIARIKRMCEKDAGWSKGSDDIYWKDLAIVRRHLFPVGALLVEPYSGFSLKQGLSYSPLQLFRFLKLLITSKGNKGYYQIHAHTPLLKDFNEQGWNDCYQRISDMLAVNENIKGMFGGSWFYDPEIKKISPRLSYLQEVPLNNGARSFCIGPDHTGNAFFKSKERIKLHEEGRYKPRAFLQVWPREKMLQWAASFKEENNENNNS